MVTERVSGGSSLIDVLDRVLDKGIVIDAWVRVALVGIDLVTVEARVVVASIATYLQFTETVGGSHMFASPTREARLTTFAKERNAKRMPLKVGTTTNGRRTNAIELA